MSQDVQTRRDFLVKGAVAGLAVASATLGDKAMAQETDPKITAINQFFAAYAENDLEGIGEVLAEDIKWTIPGHHPLSGTKVGIPEVLAFFTALGQAGFQAEPIFLETSDEYVVDIHRGFSTQGVGKVDTLWALVWHFNSEGKVFEVFNLSMDQHQMDNFIWANYNLKPLPDRLV